MFPHIYFQTEATIAITILDDEQVELLETFRVILLLVIGGARLGEVTSVNVSIPGNDSPLGRFGFQEVEVNLLQYHVKNNQTYCYCQTKAVLKTLCL